MSNHRLRKLGATTVLMLGNELLLGMSLVGVKLEKAIGFAVV